MVEKTKKNIKKVIPWLKIKAEYLQGVTPKDLGEKYKVTAKTITEKACKEKWTKEKAIICNNLQEDIQDKIKKYSNNALEVLNEVINDPEAENRDKVSACRAILDISGLKSSKQEITGAKGEPLAIQKEYILPEQIKQFEEHYKNTVGE